MNRISDYLYRLYIDYIWMTYLGFSNLWIWKKVIWHDAQFDFSFLLIILIMKLKLMEDGFNFYGCALDAKKVAQEIKRARLAIERVEKDDYSYKIFGKKDYNHPEYLIKQDIEYFTKIINKKLRTWWD